MPSYRYGPGATQRRDLEYGLLEAVFEDRAALEVVMSEYEAMGGMKPTTLEHIHIHNI